MEKKIQKEFLDMGYGFPVVLLNVPMIKVRDIWTPDINYNLLRIAVLKALAHKPARLTGTEVRFIRHAFTMTTQAFAKRFAVTHPAVLKWERCGKKPTTMMWTTEKDLRLFVMSQLRGKDHDIVMLYKELEEQKATKVVPVKIDVDEGLAA